jgi:hypothetical protein
MLTKSGEVLRRITSLHWTLDEFRSESNQNEMGLKESAIEARIGEPVKETELDKSYVISVVIPEYEVYESYLEYCIHSPEVG